MLSDVNIKELNRQVTDTYISTATYPTLLQNLVEKSPISTIVDEINTQLTLIVKSDKTNIESFLVNKAYASQIQQDIEENQSDAQEMRKDLLLSSQLTQKTAALREKISTYGLRIQNDCANIDYLLDKIKELNQQIANYDATHYQPTTHEHSHGPTTHGHSHGQTTHGHSHGQTTHGHSHGQTTHRHSHEQTTHGHSHEQTTHGHSHEQTTHGHGNAEVSLKKQKLISLKEKLHAKLNVAQKSLSEIQLEYDKIKDHAQAIGKSLTIELPKKALQRNERAIARTAREDARQNNASRKQHLSPHNYQLLVQTIAVAHQNIDKQEKQLKDEVANQSYPLFVKHIQTNLKAESKLSYHETEALKQVTIHMHNHFEALEKRAIEMKKLKSAQSNKNRLVDELQKEEQKIHQLKNPNSVLESQNQQLLEQNQQLEKTIEQRHTLKNRLLKISAFTFLSTGTLLGGAFLAMKLLPLAVSLIPLLFIPAGVTAIAIIGLLIASLIYTVLINSGKSQLKQNIATIASNSELISNQNDAIKTLEQVTIPSLKTQQSDAEQLVTELERRINDLEQEAELFLNKARNVNPAATKDPSSIFTPPTPETTEPSSSASPSKEDIDFVSVIYRP